MTKRKSVSLVAGLFLLMSAACSSSKGPADEAIKSAQAAYDAAKGDALKYVPDQAHSVEATLSAAKASYDKGEYIDITVFEGARTGPADLTRMWSDATAAYQSGNISNDVATATVVKDQAVRIMSSLGMQIPIASGD